MVTQEKLTAYLEQVVSDWPRQSPGRGYGNAYPMRPFYRDYPPVARSTTARELAQRLLASTEFRALRLGSWLQSPDGKLITLAVEALSPPPLSEDIKLLVDAVTLASTLQRNQGRGTAVVVGVLATMGMTLLMAAARHSN